MSTAVVVTPVYATPQNERLELLDLTLRSVRKQSYSNLVHLVVDDGSPSDVKGLIDSLRDPRFRYVRREKTDSEKLTASNPLNLGIDLVLGRSPDVFTGAEAADISALTYLHSDDLFTKDSLRSRMSKLGSGFVYSDMASFSGEKKIIGISRLDGTLDNDDLLQKGPNMIFNHHTTLWTLHFLEYLRNFNSRKYGQYSVFDPRISFGEDRDASLSSLEAATECGMDVRHIPEITVFYRVHDQSITGDDARDNYSTRESDSRLISLKHFGYAKNPTFHGQFLVEIAKKLTGDLPWSLFHYIPKDVKNYLKPFKAAVKKWNMTADDRKLIEHLQQTLAH